MRTIHLPPDADVAAFKAATRRCLAAGLSPRDVSFAVSDIPSPLADLPTEAPPQLTVPRAFVVLMEDAIRHPAPDRFALLYDLLWRITHGERHALDQASDPVVAQLTAYAEAVHREAGATPLQGLRTEAAACTRCALHEHATQTVFGEGPADAPVMLVGEQPGDQEDLAGRPFVGPAGQLLDRALAEAGVDRARVYVTNAVKHFKHEPRGKRRLHKKPNAGEVQACRWWLDREIAMIAPKLIVALGATAATALSGRAISVTRERGRPIDLGGLPGLVTVHPSYLLRLPDPDSAAAEYARFVADLRRVGQRVEEVKRAA